MTDNDWMAVLTEDQSSQAARQRVLEEMRTALQSGDEKQCNYALNTIIHVGMEAVDLRPDLAALWRARYDPAIARLLVPALGRVGEVPALVEALNNVEHARVLRRNVPQALRSLGPAAAPAAPGLVESLRDDDKRQEAINALTAIGTAAIPPLLAGLSDASSRLRSRALRTLGFIGVNAVDVQTAAIRALQDSEAAVRAQAIFALRHLKPLSQEGFAGIVNALSDAEHSVRWEATWALRELGPGAAAATAALISRLLPGDTDGCLDAVEALAAIGPGAAAAGPALQALLDDDNGNVRVAAASALSRLGHTTTIPLLLAEARNADHEVRCAAIDALVKVGAAGVAEARTVAGALADSDADVRTAAARAAPAFRGCKDVVIPALLRLLDDPAGDPRWQAIKSLLQLGVTNKQIGDAIKHTMKRGGWEFGPSSWDTGRCLEAIDLMRALGRAAAPLIPILEHLRDNYSELRSRAVFTLAAIRGDITTAIPELMAVLEGKSWLRQNAAACLGEIGPAARAAVPLLQRMARHGSNNYDRDAARRALQRIEGPASGGE